MSDWCEDMPEFYSETFPKARKAHRCVECAAPILLGEKHLYYRGKWDGEFGLGRQHMLCRELCMLMADMDECCPFGGMQDLFGDLDLQDDIDASHLLALILDRELRA